MSGDVDSILDQIQGITAQLDALSEGDTSRADLIARRESLRTEARTIAASLRHPRSVEAEIAMLQERLSEIEALFVTKGHAEKHLTKGFSDPGAYSANINRKLADHHAAEIRDIEQRLAELTALDTIVDDSP